MGDFSPFSKVLSQVSEDNPPPLSMFSDLGEEFDDPPAITKPLPNRKNIDKAAATAAVADMPSITLLLLLLMVSLWQRKRTNASN
jgi:hypothetical protein